MDDFVILDTDKERLFKLKISIKSFLNVDLKLKLHPQKSEYFPVDKGIDFLGYTVFLRYVLLRKSTAKRFLKKLRRKLRKIEYNEQLEELDKSFLA
jgi:hypothetical protein